jgi:GMP synthase-like glutamine amidotransferase
MVMKVLFIQQDHVSPHGPVGEVFTDRGYDVVEMEVVPGDRFHTPSVSVQFPDPRDFDAIVPMGAPWSVYDHDRIGTWVRDEIDFLREALEADVPVLGICFGGQLLAAALGGAVIPADRPEVGWTSVETTRPDLIEPGPWFQWHGDRWVLPEGMRAIAWTDVAEQAFVTGRSLGLQFHPELTPDMLDLWLGNGGDQHALDMGFDPEVLVASTRAREQESLVRSRALVNAFIDRVARAQRSEPQPHRP